MFPKKLKRDLMPARIKRAKKQLEKLSHDHVRQRDSKEKGIIGGYCFDCGVYVEGQQFQAGHWIPSSVGGALLRYHPLNMNGQAGGCNCGYQQEMVKIRYTRAMYQKYGENACNSLLGLKNRVIKADIYFYETLIDLYKTGDEKKIIHFLENVA